MTGINRCGAKTQNGSSSATFRQAVTLWCRRKSCSSCQSCLALIYFAQLLRSQRNETFNFVRNDGVMFSSVFNEAMIHDLRVFLRWAEERQGAPTAAILNSRTLQSTPESGADAGYDGAKKRKGRKVHLAVDTLGHFANEQDRTQVDKLCADLQAATGERVEIASGLHRRSGCRGGGATRYPTRSRQVVRSQTRLRPAAAPLGRGTKLRLDRALSPLSARLRATDRYAQGDALHHLCYFICQTSD